MERFSRSAGLVAVADAPVTVLGNTITQGTLIVLPDGTQVRNPDVVGGFVGALPVQIATTATAQASSRIWGAEINATSRICSIFSDHARLIAGFRYIDLDEGLTITDDVSLNRGNAPLTSPFFSQQNPPGSGQIVSIPLPVPPPGINTLTQLNTFDRILTHNRFYGFHLGGAFDYSCGNWELNVVGTIGLGQLHQIVEFQGSTTSIINMTDPVTGAIIPGTGIPQTRPGGLLTAPTDLGRHSRDRWSFVPEVSVSLGYNWTHNIKTYIGYDFLLIGNVVRPGEQIGFASTTSQVTIQGQNTTVSVIQPGFRYSQVDLWLQGIHAGIEFRF
jgi:hypothetical protein